MYTLVLICVETTFRLDRNENGRRLFQSKKGVVPIFPFSTVWVVLLAFIVLVSYTLFVMRGR